MSEELNPHNIKISFNGREIKSFEEDELKIELNPDKTEDIYERLYLTNEGKKC